MAHDISNNNYSVGLTTGERVKISTQNAEILAWPALQYVVSSGIDVKEWILEAVPRQSLPENFPIWSLPPEMPQEIKTRVIAVIIECGIRKGRIRESEQCLHLWTDDQGHSPESATKNQPSTPPDWCLDFYEKHVMPSSPELDAIRPLVKKIRALSSENLLHRGEGAPYFGPIKSGLKRQFDVAQPELLKAHQTIRRQAFRYVDHNDPKIAVMEAQHMGVPTNFIDFTTAPMVALFFASRDISNDGRVISIHTEHDGYSVLSGAVSSHNRIKAQSGVFVESQTGVILDDWIVQEIEVPKGVKRTVTSYLGELWNLNRLTMFRDLSGLADEVNESLIRFPHAIFADGKSALEKGNYSRAIRRFTEYIDSSEAERRHLRLGGTFNKPAYFNRAIAFYSIGKRREALADLEKAKEIGEAHPSSRGPDLDLINEYLRRFKRGVLFCWFRKYVASLQE